MSTVKSLAELGQLNLAASTAAATQTETVTETVDEDEVVESTKPRKTTGKGKVKPRHKVGEPPAPVVPASDDQEQVDAPDLANAEQVAAIEEALSSGVVVPESEVPEGYKVEEQKEVVQETIVTLLRKECHICHHLFPTAPTRIPKKYGGGKEEYGHAFPCYTDDGCPAQHVQFIFNPFTDDILKEAVDLFKSTGDVDRMKGLYKEAKDMSEAIWADVHRRVTEMLKD